ncbi:MAG: cytochrome c biogenesis protein CcmE [Alphaproteobacteria bacterium 41-28]|nr:MAG: cytochrome c biogenesis protein CcmE [Alphaproteobacteria bacterium 41-28]
MFHVKHKHQRLLLICSGLIGLGIAAFLTLTAFQDALIFYYMPSDFHQKKISPEQRIRMGGLVEPLSLHQDGEKVSFRITDQKESMNVTYQGILPDLFREGQGVVVEGYLLNPKEFQAQTVLAKHDENYMPKEVADRLRDEGLWRDAQ